MSDDLAETLKSFDRSLQQLPSLFVQKVALWAIWPVVPESRQMLETDPWVIRPEGEQVLNASLQNLASKRPLSNDLFVGVQRRQRIFSTALTHGASQQAVRDAYVAEYGALDCFELPSWLNALRPRLASDSAEEAAKAYNEAIDRIRQEPSGVAREVMGAVAWGWGNALVRSGQARLGLFGMRPAAAIFTSGEFPWRLCT